MKKLVMLAVLLGVLSPASAWAESAWILWRSSEVFDVNGRQAGTSPGIWGRYAMFPTSDECRAAARKRAEWEPPADEPGYNVKSREIFEFIGGGFGVKNNLKQPEGAWTWQKFRCYPDTVNPWDFYDYISGKHESPRGSPRE
jgi:hypothetical protein